MVMIDLNHCSSEEVETFGRNLLKAHQTDLRSFEDAATVCVRAIYDGFGQQNNTRSFALVRIYRLCRHGELLPELQAISDPSVAEWMALMGTAGSQPAWCDRRTSNAHKAIRAVGENRSPMLTAAFNQLGFGNVAQADKMKAVTPTLIRGGWFTSYFHVPRAFGSPFIPAQREFVEPYRIESAVGIGCRFASKALYLGVCFSTIGIDEAAARKFAVISLYISTLLAIYDGRRTIWS
jgi:hypothetical protein